MIPRGIRANGYRAECVLTNNGRTIEHLVIQTKTIDSSLDFVDRHAICITHSERQRLMSLIPKRP